MQAQADNFVATLATSSMRAVDGRDRPHYCELIEAALASEPPTYATQRFADLFRLRGRDASWLASLLASDSYMEGYSAGRLWQYAASLGDAALAEAMRRHARDEAKHSRMFSAAVLRTFPSLDCEDLSRELYANAPDLDHLDVAAFALDTPSDDELLNSILLINLFEIKALLLGLMTKPLIVAHAPQDRRGALGRMMDTILGDEARHILYSADFLEAKCRHGQRAEVASGLHEHQATLNLLTLKDLEADLSQERNI